MNMAGVKPFTGDVMKYDSGGQLSSRRILVGKSGHGVVGIRLPNSGKGLIGDQLTPC